MHNLRVPTGHRAFRLLIFVVLFAAAVATARSPVLASTTDRVVDRGARITKAIWNPLIHGGGWAQPLFPAPSPSLSGSPAPSASASPAATPLPARTPAPSPTRKKK